MIPEDCEGIPLVHVSDDGVFNVHFSLEVLSKITTECRRVDRMETGGILLGRYSKNGRVAHILDCSQPPRDSLRRLRSFLRGVKGIKTLLDRFWRDGQYYLGEWHYHPHSSSYPSAQDIRQMLEIAREPGYKCPEPILLVVGGSAQTGWEVNVRIFRRSGDSLHMQAHTLSV
jgi:integrative and conjugative element protein (TIGR02256 family)